jgi:hypothetical protein
VLPLAPDELPQVQHLYGPWQLATGADGTALAPLADQDQPGCLAGPLADLHPRSVNGRDYVPEPGRADPPGDPAGLAAPATRAYQYVLVFADSTAAARAGQLLNGAYGCKGGHGGVRQAVRAQGSTVLQDDFTAAVGRPARSLEEFTVAVRGDRVAVLGVWRACSPGGFGCDDQAATVHAQFAVAAALLADRLTGSR